MDWWCDLSQPILHAPLMKNFAQKGFLVMGLIGTFVDVAVDEAEVVVVGFEPEIVGLADVGFLGVAHVVYDAPKDFVGSALTLGLSLFNEGGGAKEGSRGKGSEALCSEVFGP